MRDGAVISSFFFFFSTNISAVTTTVTILVCLFRIALACQFQVNIFNTAFR